MTADITSLIAVRVITDDDDAAFERVVRYYEALLDRPASGDDGRPAAVRHARFDIGGVELVIAKEPEPTPEAGTVRQGPAWLCFRAPDPDGAWTRAAQAGVDIAGPVTDTSFGTRAFFDNDPSGLAVYVGTDWRTP